MKALIKRLNDLEHKIEHGERILLEEHALNLAPRINALFYELVRSDKEAAVAIEHLKSKKSIKEKKSLAELLDVALLPYENRTIQIEKDNPDYEGIVSTLKSFRNMDFVASYRHYLFDPLSRSMWEEHELHEGTRLIFYALDMGGKGNMKHERQVSAIQKVADYLGRPVSHKRKKYGKYASLDYTINHGHGLHARPSAQIVMLAKEYDGDVWIRTEDQEINAKSILHLMALGAKAGKQLTVLYKPKEQSREFYERLEGIETANEKLLVRCH